jgi:hypothetical protein
MLAIPYSVRIHLAVEPVDMRKSFNGLWSAVSERLRGRSQKRRLVRVHQPKAARG